MNAARTIVMIALLSASAPRSAGAEATGRTFGAGIVLGAPSGLTAKLFIGAPSAVQMHLGFGFGGGGRLVVIVDYLYHFVGVLPAIDAGSFVPYAGVGGRLGVRDRDNDRDRDAFLGVRIPLGVSFLISAVRIEIFVEVAPGIALLPETDGTVDGGLGGRFYF